MKTLYLITFLFATVTLKAQEPMALLAGSKAPIIDALDYQQKAFSLDKSLATGPVVVVFYRGEWCSYCNKHMSQLEESISEFKKLGASVVAITPEQPKFVKKTEKKTNASFRIISDHEHKIMDAWGVSFKLDDETYERYKGWWIKIDKASGNNDRILPVPATYIVGKSGLIEAVHFNTDYTERMPVSEMLDIVRSLK